MSDLGLNRQGGFESHHFNLKSGRDALWLVPSCLKRMSPNCPAQTWGRGGAALGTFCPRECFRWVYASENAFPSPFLCLSPAAPRTSDVSGNTVIELGCMIFKCYEPGFSAFWLGKGLDHGHSVPLYFLFWSLHFPEMSCFWIMEHRQIRFYWDPFPSLPSCQAKAFLPIVFKLHVFSLLRPECVPLGQTSCESSPHYLLTPPHWAWVSCSIKWRW